MFSGIEMYDSNGGCLVRGNHCILQTAIQPKELIDGGAITNHLVHFEDQQSCLSVRLLANFEEM